jgi:hypothetical protein
MSEPRKELADRIVTRLAGRIVDVELDPEDLEECIRTALDQYRNRSSNSVEEGYFFLELQEDKSEYILPQEIVEVREIFRRGLGRTQGGVTFDPFSAAFTNFYLIEAGRQGGLATYALFTEYQELIGTLFGEHIMFAWDSFNHRLRIVRNIRGPETVLLWCYYERADEELMHDRYAKMFIIDYAVARAKVLLGEGRGKFSQIVGPQGGTTLNGDQIKQEGIADMDRLERELMEYGFGEEPLTFLIG